MAGIEPMQSESECLDPAFALANHAKGAVVWHAEPAKKYAVLKYHES